MKRERDYSSLESIFAQRAVCIRPNGPNYDKAKEDFENGRARYYSYDVSNGIKGYVRLLPNSLGLFVDFISPYSDGSHQKVLLDIAKRHKKTGIYIAYSNLHDSLKEQCEEAGEMDLRELFKEVKQLVYCASKQKIMRIPRL